MSRFNLKFSVLLLLTSACAMEEEPSVGLNDPRVTEHSFAVTQADAEEDMPAVQRLHEQVPRHALPAIGDGVGGRVWARYRTYEWVKTFTAFAIPFGIVKNDAYSDEDLTGAKGFRTSYDWEVIGECGDDYLLVVVPGGPSTMFKKFTRRDWVDGEDKIIYHPHFTKGYENDGRRLYRDGKNGIILEHPRLQTKFYFEEIGPKDGKRKLLTRMDYVAGGANRRNEGGKRSVITGATVSSRLQLYRHRTGDNSKKLAAIVPEVEVKGRWTSPKGYLYLSYNGDGRLQAVRDYDNAFDGITTGLVHNGSGHRQVTLTHYAATGDGGFAGAFQEIREPGPPPSGNATGSTTLTTTIKYVGDALIERIVFSDGSGERVGREGSGKVEAIAFMKSAASNQDFRTLHFGDDGARKILVSLGTQTTEYTFNATLYRPVHIRTSDGGLVTMNSTGHQILNILIQPKEGNTEGQIYYNIGRSAVNGNPTSVGKANRVTETASEFEVMYQVTMWNEYGHDYWLRNSDAQPTATPYDALDTMPRATRTQAIETDAFREPLFPHRITRKRDYDGSSTAGSAESLMNETNYVFSGGAGTNTMTVQFNGESIQRVEKDPFGEVLKISRGTTEVLNVSRAGPFGLPNRITTPTMQATMTYGGGGSNQNLPASIAFTGASGNTVQPQLGISYNPNGYVTERRQGTSSFHSREVFGYAGGASVLSSPTSASVYVGNNSTTPAHTLQAVMDGPVMRALNVDGRPLLNLRWDMAAQ